MRKSILTLALILCCLAARAGWFGNPYTTNYVVAYPTNWIAFAVTPSPNVTNYYSYYQTNGSFTFGPLTGGNKTAVYSCVVAVTNSGNSTITLSPHASFDASGTWNVTNGGYSVITFTLFGGFRTNAICFPVK